MDHRFHPFQMGFSAGAELVLADRGLPDGYLLGHRGSGAAPGTDGGGFRDQSGSPGDCFPGESGTRLSDATRRTEPFYVVAFSKTFGGGSAGGHSDDRSSVRRCPANHLSSVPDHGAATVF